MQILDEGTVDLGGINQLYQNLSILILSGQHKGMIADVSYEKNQIQSEGLHFRPGDKIMVVAHSGQGNTSVVVDYVDAVRILVGSLGLVTAVPISTLVATLLALYSDRLGVIRPYLGPETRGEVLSH